MSTRVRTTEGGYLQLSGQWRPGVSHTSPSRGEVGRGAGWSGPPRTSQALRLVPRGGVRGTGTGTGTGTGARGSGRGRVRWGLRTALRSPLRARVPSTLAGPMRRAAGATATRPTLGPRLASAVSRAPCAWPCGAPRRVRGSVRGAATVGAFARLRYTCSPVRVRSSFMYVKRPSSLVVSRHPCSAARGFRGALRSLQSSRRARPPRRSSCWAAAGRVLARQRSA